MAKPEFTLEVTLVVKNKEGELVDFRGHSDKPGRKISFFPLQIKTDVQSYEDVAKASQDLNALFDLLKAASVLLKG